MGFRSWRSSANAGARSLKAINPHLVRTFAPALTRLFSGGRRLTAIFASVRKSRRSATVLTVCTILASCSTSQEQGPLGATPVSILDSVNLELAGKYALMRVDEAVRVEAIAGSVVP
jgi:hypothetical protein